MLQFGSQRTQATPSVVATQPITYTLPWGSELSWVGRQDGNSRQYRLRPVADARMEQLRQFPGDPDRGVVAGDRCLEGPGPAQRRQSLLHRLLSPERHQVCGRGETYPLWRRG